MGRLAGMSLNQGRLQAEKDPFFDKDAEELEDEGGGGHRRQTATVNDRGIDVPVKAGAMAGGAADVVAGATGAGLGKRGALCLDHAPPAPRVSDAGSE